MRYFSNSSSSDDSDDEEESSNDLPYIFINENDELVKKVKGQRQIDLIQEQFNKCEAVNLNQKIGCMYRDLLIAVSEYDNITFSKYCEKNLYNKFSQGALYLDKNVKKVEVLNLALTLWTRIKSRLKFTISMRAKQCSLTGR